MDNNELLRQIRFIVKEEVNVARDDIKNDIKDDIKKLNEKMYAMEQRLTERIDGVELKLTKRIDEVDQKLTKRIDGVELKLTKKIDEVDQKLANEVGVLHKDNEYIKYKIDAVYEKVAEHEEYKNKSETKYNKPNEDVSNLKLFVREDEDEENKNG
ncbi:MAG TPA: hypothetical protein DCP90_05990 [Clostridiales bacterium]|nr:MAG: hypothetical protein A2Y22_09310 [Clostridiales bacterium GWD2_32_59]HAN10144.1 hypothetical protein [Clostridiales bacterium]